jgi:hypothetical protein
MFLFLFLQSQLTSLIYVYFQRITKKETILIKYIDKK